MCKRIINYLIKSLFPKYKEKREISSRLRDIGIDHNKRDEKTGNFMQFLGISVDINTSEISGKEFWDIFFEDLRNSLGVDYTTDIKSARNKLTELYSQFILENNLIITKLEKERVLKQLSDHFFGLGILQPLLDDEHVTLIMVNGGKNIYVERKGKLTRVPAFFPSDVHVMHVIDRMLIPLGICMDESRPFVDVRLSDDSILHAVIPPISLVGPTLTIRVFSKNRITIEQFIKFGSITPEALQFLKACVEARLNIVISGGRYSGRSVLLNILSEFIPNDERIVTIENAAGLLQLRQEHVVTLETCPPNFEGRGEVTMKDLVVNSLQMYPDRIVVNGMHGGAALDMLQAMSSGYNGSMISVFSNGPRDTIARIETMCHMRDAMLPIRNIRYLIASAIDLIVHMERLRDGQRKIVLITEVTGIADDIVTCTDIFAYKQTGYFAGKVKGDLHPKGLWPKFMEKFVAAGIHLPPKMFGLSSRREEKLEPVEVEEKFSKGKYAYLSYIRKDKQNTYKLARAIENQGFDIWVDEWDIPLDEDWSSQYEKRIKDSGLLLLVLNQSSLKSKYVRSEIAVALEKGKPILPVLIGESELPVQLKSWRCIPVELNKEKYHIDNIVRALKVQLRN